jgi:hypothetical protein
MRNKFLLSFFFLIKILQKRIFSMLKKLIYVFSSWQQTAQSLLTTLFGAIPPDRLPQKKQTIITYVY